MRDVTRFGVMAGTLVLMLACSAAVRAQEVRVVSAESAQSLERRLRVPAAEGFRVVAACHGSSLDGSRRVVVVLERGLDENRFEYAARSLPGDLGREGALDEINELASRGFRIMPDRVFAEPLANWWLPESAYDDQSVVLMERDSAAVARRYETLPYSRDRQFHDIVAQRYGEGFGVVGLWKTFRRPRLLLEHPRARADGPVAGDARPYVLRVPTMKRSLKAILKRARIEGYRIVDSADRAITAPPMVLFERVDQAEARGLRYRIWRNPLRRIRNESLARKLNKKARRGYRALPKSISDEMVVLERDKNAPRWEYRALSSKRSPGLPRMLEQVFADGFRIVTLFHASDETTALVARPLAHP